MPSFKPQGKDRLGAWSAPGTQRRAQAVATTAAIADTSSVLVELWANFHSFLITAAHPILRILAPATDDHIKFDTTAGNLLRFYIIRQGVASQNVSIPVPQGEVYLAILLNRDSGKLVAVLDRIVVGSPAIGTADPRLNEACNIYLGTIAGSNVGVEADFWRARITSIATGQVPADIDDLLRLQRNPDAPMNPTLAALVNEVGSEYRIGEGLYGSDVLSDVGEKGGCDLAWQDGETVEDVRVRAPVSIYKPKRTLYKLKTGYTADTGTVNFALAQQSAVVRVPLARMGAAADGFATARIANAGDDEVVSIYTHSGFNGTAICVKTNNILYTINLQESMNDDREGDLFIIINGTNIKAIFSGQYVGQVTSGTVLNLAGNCTLIMQGSGAPGCGIAMWNPPTIPDTLEDEIRQCVMNFEVDPPCLANSRKLKFYTTSETLPDPTSDTVDNPWGPGTSTLSAQRSDSCAVMHQGYDP